jgi:phosphoglycolate phosphatase-like HAD superfamily hydrolase
MKCFIFDLDGTLADDSHRWHYVERTGDWDAYYAACSADGPIEHVLAVARALERVGFAICIVTGRSETIRDQTVAWLIAQDVLFNELIMRKNGDRRKNSELKVAALHDLRAKGYEPLMVFEDLPAAVAAWRAAGLPCAQVADPKDWGTTHP